MHNTTRKILQRQYDRKNGDVFLEMAETAIPTEALYRWTAA
jgi:hypothetical protein